MWDFWRRHKRKLFVTLGVVGGGYAFYKLYNAYKQRLHEAEKELVSEKEHEELIKAQMQEHFMTIQRIADSTTLPHAMNYLSRRVAQDLDLSLLTERLQQGKGQPNSLTSSVKLELWNMLKILSFTRVVLSLWSMTILSLYVRVQVNILGRHLYIDTARGLESSYLLEEGNFIDTEDEQKFLASADYLASSGLPSLIYNMQAAATDCLKSKQLRDVFDVSILHDTIVEILDTFISMGKPYHWVEYLMPGDASTYLGDEGDVSRFQRLMVETRAVLSSAEFRNVVDVSLKAVVDALVKDMADQAGGGNSLSGIPLAKLLPRIAQMGTVLLSEPAENRFNQVITNIQDVELFFTLLYANSPPL
ncbi:Peroxisome biogenesis protein 3-2-like protein [Drosera capensis]